MSGGDIWHHRPPWFTLTPVIIFAAIISVTSPSELTSAIAAAVPGDEIVLADGTYALAANISCTTDATQAQPIVVRAATPMGAKIQFDTVEGFKVSGAHWHFEGLDITGVCAVDSDCEHAFHVTGAAHGFVLRGSRVRDFNAQLKVNVGMINGVYVTPNNGLVEYNEVGDTRGRMTSNPVTKLNIDTGDDWIVRGNYLHDAYKNGGDGVSYASFMKSGSKRGTYERNLVICSRDTTGGTRIGLSLGGGGTAPQYCYPAYDASVPCNIEHYGGTMRNNIIVNCSDVGIYLNRAQDTHILYNTLIGTTGVDFRFATTSGEAVGNVLTSVVRTRDTATMTESGNQMNVAVSQFQAWYRDPLVGDLAVIGDVSSLIGTGPTRSDVVNDYCAAPRPLGAAYTVGALEHSVAVCDTTRPPIGTDPVSPGTDAGPGGSPGDGGCCQTQRHPDGSALLWLFVVVQLVRSRRRR